MNRSRSRPALAAAGIGILAAAALASPLRAQPLVLQVDPLASRVQYHIAHSVSDVTDLAGTPAGQVQVGEEAGGLHLEGRVEVDLRQLQTGITQRDHHIKSQEYLDVERFPLSQFVLQSLSPDSTVTVAPTDAANRAEPAPIWKGRARGRLSLHGVERDVEIPLVLSWLEGASRRLRARSDFTIALADYGIPRPRKLIFKAGKTVDVQVDVVFAP